MSEFEETMSGRAMFGMGITPSGKAQSSHNSAEHKSAGRPLKNMWSPVELYVSDEGDEVGYYVKIEYTDTQLITGRVITTFLSVSKDTGEFGPVVRKGRIGEWVPMGGEPYNPRRPYFVFTSKSCPLLIYRIRLDNDGNVVEEHLWYAEIGKQLGEYGFVVYVKPKAEVGNDALVGRVRGVVLGGGRERLVTGATPVKGESAVPVKEEGASVDAVMAELNDELNRLAAEETESARGEVESVAEEPEAEEDTKQEPEAEEDTKQEPEAEEDTKQEPEAEEDTKQEPEAEEDTKQEPEAEEDTKQEPEARGAEPTKSPSESVSEPEEGKVPSPETPATFKVPEL